MHGAGNDFIVIGDMIQSKHRINLQTFNKASISHICDRHRGIGGDGLIIITETLSQNKTSLPLLKMHFFNNDGTRAEMCGNGLRCAALYADKYLIKKKGAILFETDAGILHTEVLSENLVQIQIPIIEQPQSLEIERKKCFKVNTGVPHLVVPVKDISSIDVIASGRHLRFLENFAPEGVNVNFILIPEENAIPVKIRTYERGVEDETSACGTGIAASAAVLALFYSNHSPITFMTQDKDIITIDFSLKENIVKGVKEILLTGPSIEVFRGTWKKY
jgi:diaminopimelate epimerase